MCHSAVKQKGFVEMERKKLKVCWISSGVSSFVAGYLERDTIDKFIYIHIDDQEGDSLRYIKDCEKVLGKEVEIIQSKQYKNVEQAVLAFGGFTNRGTGFFPCTGWLKKRVRKEWEYDHRDYDITYVWGMDLNETRRAKNIKETMIEFEHVFPLIDRQITKQDAHGISASLGIKRPHMYDMGYNNNNCVGCVKGGMGYWNKIRVDFPDVFESRAKLERTVGNTILKEPDGTPIWLDELDPSRGRMSEEIMEDCGIFCYLNME